jgi:hypothetical protein
VTQATDTEAEAQIKAGSAGLAGERHQRARHVLPPGSRGSAGLVPSGSQAGRAAVDIARKAPNVKRVETYFVSHRPSWESDVAIKERIRAVLIADPAWWSSRVDIGRLYGGGPCCCLVSGHGPYGGRKSQKFIYRRTVGEWRCVVTSYIPNGLG